VPFRVSLPEHPGAFFPSKESVSYIKRYAIPRSPLSEADKTPNGGGYY